MSTEAADGQIVNHVSYIVCGMSKEDWEMVNPAVFRVGDLKKQSQFAAGQIYTKSLVTIVYGIIRDFMWRENKAKQSQFISVQCSAFSGQRQDGGGWLMDGSALVNYHSFFLASVRRLPAGGSEKLFETSVK